MIGWDWSTVDTSLEFSTLTTFRILELNKCHKETLMKIEHGRLP